MARKMGAMRFTLEEAGSVGMGQVGSVFIDTVDQDITSPSDADFVAITVLEDCQFNDLVASEPNKCIGTSGTASTSGPPGYVIDNSNTFPAGITIFGRWTKIDIDSGSVVAYLG